MDDPWGSPWADEIQTQQSVEVKEKKHVGNRPMTPVRASTLAPKEKTSSPWDETADDGYGEWAAVPADGNEAIGYDGEDDKWDKAAIHNRGLTETPSTALSIPWAPPTTSDSDGNTPKLSPSLLPKSLGTVRQPSPDPWATTEINSNDVQPENHVLPAGYGAQVEVLQEVGIDASIGHNTSDDPVQAAVCKEEPLLDIEKGTSSVNDGSVETVVGKEAREVPAVEHTQEIQEVDLVSSRPSSSPSERSHHDELPQESPRTSVDEDPKRPQMPRAVSSKVQELVQHFNGLTQQTVGEPIGDGTDAQVGNNDADETEADIDDFGDFEDGPSENPSPSPEEQLQASGKAVYQDDAGETMVVQQGSQTHVPIPGKDHGPIEFKIDTSLLDQLYPGVEPDSAPEQLFIPDTIPHDSFTTTEERKTWYRISRYGTMRKYNTGDDENYVRVTWSKSKFRDETLKIVARWMEEDRLSGRVVLGGGSKGSSVFGWNDPKAPAVPLSQAFATTRGAQKPEVGSKETVSEIPREWPKGLVKGRSTSQSPSSSKNKRRGSAKLAVAPEGAKIGSPTSVANFGWNAAPEKLSDPKTKPSDLGRRLSTSIPSLSLPTKKSASTQGPSSSIGSSTAISPDKSTQSPAPPLSGDVRGQASVMQNNLPGLPNLVTDNVAADDDWGEMISSPATGIPDVFSPPGLRHTNSQLLGGMFLPEPKISSSVQQIQSSRSSLTYDNVLVPQSLTSQTTAQIRPFEAGQVAADSPPPVTGDPDQRFTAIKVPVTGGTLDPWASADFSFFDTSPAPPTGIVSSTVPDFTSTKSVSFGIPATPVDRGDQKSREQMEQDRIVQSVVKALPDLSYMLRR